MPFSTVVISNQPGWGWAATLLPYVEQKPLFDKIDFQSPVEGPGALAIRTTTLSIYTYGSADPRVDLAALTTIEATDLLASRVFEDKPTTTETP